MAAVPREWREAAERWGYLADGQAHKYGLPNGATLLLKIASGESGFNMRAVSSAGARGGTQFISSTRQSYVEKYGIDPWKNPDEAMHATAIFMKTSGLAGYNSGGGQEYIDYILGQKVGVGREAAQGGKRGKPGKPPKPKPGESSLGERLREIGLVGVLVLGGAAMIGLGATRMLGTTQ